MKRLLPVLLFVSSVSCADTASDIKALILGNFKHTQQEDIKAVMGDMHTQSPSYLGTQKLLRQLFPTYDLNYTLVKYTFVAEDGEYAYAKIKQRTKKVSGPEFKNNELEALMIFKKENGRWKFWTQASLSVSYI